MQRPINSFYPVLKKDVGATFDFSDYEDDDDYAVNTGYKRKRGSSRGSRATSATPSNDLTSANPTDDNLSGGFNLLPIEMNQRLAKYLDGDRDLDSFRRTCKATFNSIDGDGMSFWRCRFLESFEKPTKTVNNLWYRKNYHLRKQALIKGTTFSLGHNKDEEKCLDVLRTLIIEAFSEKKDGDINYESKNIAALKHFVQNHNILQNIFDPHQQNHYTHRQDLYRRPTEPLLEMIQVLLAPFMLEPGLLYEEVFQFPLSQQMAYASAAEQPIFIGHNGVSINMPWLLHQLNFWKYHMMRQTELTLFNAYDSLSELERPAFWSNLLSSSPAAEQNIGKHWKGAYGFVSPEEVFDIREGQNEDIPIQDEFCGDDGSNTLQDLNLKLNTNRESDWNPVFEIALKSLSKPTSTAKTRAQKRSADSDEITHRQARSFRFTGDGADSTESFLADGWLNPLPAQMGVPGWQRMTMIKYFADDFGNIDYSALWAYEGVVLPGGQIILGRWWSPTDDDLAEHYTGPFIHWCVDAAPHLEEEEEEGSQEL